MRWTILLLLLAPFTLAAQVVTQPLTVIGGAPAGSCDVTAPVMKVTAQGMYQCLGAPGSPIGLWTQVGSGGTASFSCSAYATLAACVAAANAYAGANETGQGHAVLVSLQDKTYLTGGVPIPLNSGVHIIGVMPRTVTTPGSSPDDTMQANGGSWMDCGDAPCFTGSNLNSVVLENMGFKNFTTALLFGGNNVQGMAQSRLINLWFQGINTLNASTSALTLYNPAHVEITGFKANYVNNGITIISQSSLWIPGNTDIRDFYVATYTKSVANGNNGTCGIQLSVLVPSLGSALPLNAVHFIGQTQVSIPATGDGTGYAFCSTGIPSAHVQNTTVAAADIEPGANNGFNFAYTDYSQVQVSVFAGSGNGATFDANSSANALTTSLSPFPWVDNNAPSNTLNGNQMRGSYNFASLLGTNGITNATGNVNFNGTGTAFFNGTGVSQTLAQFGAASLKCLFQNGGNPTSDTSFQCLSGGTLEAYVDAGSGFWTRNAGTYQVGFPVLWTEDANGKPHYSGAAPTITGTGCTLSWGTDDVGQIALSSATTCTITFGHAWTNNAACTGVLSTGTAVGFSAQSKSACTLTFASTTGTLNYQALGN